MSVPTAIFAKTKIQKGQRRPGDCSQRMSGRGKDARRRYKISRNQEIQYLELSLCGHRIDCEHAFPQDDHSSGRRKRNALLRPEVQAITFCTDPFDKTGNLRFIQHCTHPALDSVDLKRWR